MSGDELEELAKRIEFRLKLGKFDALFLFVPTLLGLAFSLFQYYLSYLHIVEPNAMITFLPILIVGIGLPVYIGYYRGGIKLDSVIERARGWIYLVGGAGNYIALIVGLTVALSSPAWLVPLYIVAMIVAEVLVIVIALRIGLRIPTLFGEKISVNDTLALASTAFSSFHVGFTLVIVFHPYRGLLNATKELWKIPLDATWDFPLIVASLVSGLVAWLWFEQHARAQILGKKTKFWFFMVSGIPVLSVAISAIPQAFAEMLPQYTPTLFIFEIALAVSVPTFTYALLTHYHTRE